MPYLRAWYERYSDLAFEIVGVHTPEFSFERHGAQVQAAVGRLGIRWPVVLDNEKVLWNAYANRSWPSVYLIDARGYVRFSHIGEGGYEGTERAIQALLAEVTPGLTFPEPLPPVRPEDAPGAVCVPCTPELHADALGNPRASGPGPHAYDLPADREDGRVYLEGRWKTAGEGLVADGDRGVIALPFHAASVNAVLAPVPQTGSAAVTAQPPAYVDLLLDGQPLLPDEYAEDVLLHEGRAAVRVEVPRMYSLVRLNRVQRHELRLTARTPGLTFYAFSFGSCLAPQTRRKDQIKE